ncbi:BCNT-domain-containing protein [Coniochaeta ligniaria NRRL 30616]|uniref:SWR1-complex protein 5 n=1 Tax=Coniochaeta ligniaria NRRL 30616 TaxID=1408157 RepID=A0A1J7J1Z0_9PEZI|nr:BCNT-domain-containing protein [Coniochaeta ligniaria NRRL 30616]
MPPDPILDQEEDYASSEDSDFAPEEAVERESTPSEDEEADATPNQPAATSKRKRQQAGDNEAEDAGFENSGDEAIIGKGKKRLKRATRQNGYDDEGGEGGLVKTRAQRALEKVERKYAAVKGPVTIDVDALWQQMLSDAPVVSTGTAQDAERHGDEVQILESPSKGAQQPGGGTGAAADATGETDAMIRIKRTYNFAGKVHTEEKLVARDSAEAKLYLASLGEADPAAVEDDQPAKRMPRKAFRSIFEPVTDQQQQRSDLNLGMGVLRRARELATRAEAKKLNTVEKSRMDWAGYVDKEGIKDELELAGKSKTSFVGRQDFLARSEARREEEARRARLAGKV